MTSPAPSSRRAYLIVLVVVAAIATVVVFLARDRGSAESRDTTVANGSTTQPAIGPGVTATSQSPVVTTGPVATSQPITTTAPPSTETSATPVPTGDSPVGYLGCSNTTRAVDGYHEVGGQRMWRPRSMNGGTVVNWTLGEDAARFWETFDILYTAEPTTTIWWQLCVRANESDALTYDAALILLSMLEEHAPGATVYASAINGWVAPHICSQVGPDKGRIDALVSQLVSEGRVFAGPVVADIFGQDSAGTGVLETASEGCHPNGAGRAKIGEDLLAFFG